MWVASPRWCSGRSGTRLEHRGPRPEFPVAMVMDQTTRQALETLAQGGRHLRGDWHFDWPAAIQQAIHRLGLGGPGSELPTFVAVVGGASSGKSTVFNNILEGHLTSRITARGHTTLGPILAVHEAHRPFVEASSEAGRFLPEYRRIPIELDDNVVGDPGAVAILYHHLDALRDVFLFDLPDFTSDAASKEGEVTLSLLPWFDRLLVVVDHERWFDRQSISRLRTESARFGQDRLALFNRTREGPLAKTDEAVLRGQADRLGAAGMVVLAFRRGRGFCLFPPGALDEVGEFLRSGKRQRDNFLLERVAEAANRTLNQNEERAARLNDLRESVQSAVDRVLPSSWDCMTALMTPEERRQLEPAARVLRLHETKDWVRAQTRRVQTALKRVPIVGPLVFAPGGQPHDEEPNHADRFAIGAAYYEAAARRQVHEVQRVVRASSFWDEVRRWTGLEPADREFACPPARRDQVRGAIHEFDLALIHWTEKVEAECRGISPNIHGAIGTGAIALVIVLIAVPGPVAALSFVAAKGAIGAALTQLAAATGAGALLGKHLGRLGTVIRERLLGTPEFEAVQAAAAAFRGQLETAGRELAAEAVTEASSLVMEEQEPLTVALRALRDAGEEEA